MLLACGNSLRGDDGVGLRIAEAVEELLPASRLRIVAVQQWTPELAGDLAEAGLAIFVDASATDEAGEIRVRAIAGPAEPGEWPGLETHRLDPHRLEPEALMALAQQLCGHGPARAFAVTVGAGSFQYGEEISGKVRQAVPRAVRLVGNLVAAFASPA